MTVSLKLFNARYTFAKAVVCITLAQPGVSLAFLQESSTTQAQSNNVTAEGAEALQQALKAFHTLLEDKGTVAAEKQIDEWIASDTDGEEQLIQSAISSFAIHCHRTGSVDEAIPVLQRGFDYFIAEVKKDNGVNPVWVDNAASIALSISIYSKWSSKFEESGPKTLDDAIDVLLPLQFALSRPNEGSVRVVRLVNQAHRTNPSDKTKKYTEELSKLTQRWIEKNVDDPRSHIIFLESQIENGVSAGKLVALADSLREKFPRHPILMDHYVRLVIDAASKQMDSSPTQAKDLLENLKGEVERANYLSDTNRTYSLQMIDSSLEGIRPAVQRAELIGQPAPVFDAAAWANGAPVTIQDLRGKVILLDFWAVWCGPCIATFPHLKEWDEKYADRGLVVIGATSKFNCQWNEETKQIVRCDEQSMDDEVAMLEKFLAHHQLKHRTMVNPAESKMESQYGVEGIPHAVLIDRSGIVRMIRQGYSDENNKALQEMVEKLLQDE